MHAYIRDIGRKTEEEEQVCLWIDETLNRLTRIPPVKLLVS